MLNKHVKIAAKSTTTNHSENLKDLDVEIIANPFSIISSEVNMALIAPNLLKLEKWLYRIDNLSVNLPSFPMENILSVDMEEWEKRFMKN